MIGITQEKWNSLSSRDQAGNIAAELVRVQSIEKKADKSFFQMLECALVLIDLSIDDPKRKDDFLALSYLRDMVASVYAGQEKSVQKIIAVL